MQVVLEVVEERERGEDRDRRERQAPDDARRRRPVRCDQEEQTDRQHREDRQLEDVRADPLVRLRRGQLTAEQDGHRGAEDRPERDGRQLRDLLEEIERADQVGLDVFGVGEHHRKEFLDSAPTEILAAAAARTTKIRLTSAVTVLSAADPVRVFQSFATLDLISRGRAEMIVGRGSFIEAFPLFGYKLEDYDSLFADKLDLLLAIRDNEFVHWSGKHRPPLTGQGVYPRPVQDPLPIWLGVGGTPGSFARAGALGLPLMVAIIGGETRRFRPLVDLYREAGRLAGFGPERLKVGVHALGYLAPNAKEAADDHSEALGGLSRITFMMNAATVPHEKLMRAVELLGTRVAPILRKELASPVARA